MVTGFITLVGVGQAFLFHGQRPRLASILMGLLCYTAPSLATWFIGNRMMPPGFVMMMLGNGIVGGNGQATFLPQRRNGGFVGGGGAADLHTAILENNRRPIQSTDTPASTMTRRPARARTNRVSPVLMLLA